jgi:hypothetical protein
MTTESEETADEIATGDAEGGAVDCGGAECDCVEDKDSLETVIESDVTDCDSGLEVDTSDDDEVRPEERAEAGRDNTERVLSTYSNTTTTRAHVANNQGQASEKQTDERGPASLPLTIGEGAVLLFEAASEVEIGADGPLCVCI